MSNPKRTPPQGVPFRRVRDKVPQPCPPFLTAKTWGRLNRHIEWTIMRRDGGRDHLRVSVKVAVAEMRLAGLTSFEIASVLTSAVVEHPARLHHDSASLLTGELRSATLTKNILRWIAVNAPEGESTPSE